MPQAWRIVKEKYAASAFDGEGARLNGGRWNSTGLRVVYASSTKSLAALEILIHLKLPVISKYVAIPIQFADGLVEVFPAGKLPIGWDVEPVSPASQWIGDAWVKAARSAVLAVPSI